MERQVQRPAGVVSRRHFLYMAGGVATVAASGGLLAACGGSASPTASSGSSAGTSPTPSGGGQACDPSGTFSLFTWAGYEGLEVEPMKTWWAESGIDPNIKNLSNENLLNIMKSPAGKEWDAFTINQGDNNYYFTEGVLSEVTVDEVPALAKMYKGIVDSPIFQVREGVYNAVPWTMGPLGINFINGKIDPITSYAEVLDPRFKNRVGCYDSSLNMISTAACAVKLDPGRLTSEELNGPVKEWLVKLRPQLKLISPSLGDQLTTLVSGDVDLQLVGLTWNVLQGKQQNVDVAFVYPDEGTYGFVDSIGITMSAPNRCAALAYANAVMTPEYSAPLQASLVALGTTDDINNKMKETNPEERGLFPDDIVADFMGKMKWNVSWVDPEPGFALIEEWDKVWNEIKAL